MGRVLSILGVVVGSALLAPAAASALSLEPIGSFASPVYVTSDPGDADQLFVVEQGGTIQRTGSGTTTEFLDIADDVEFSGERGLFSIALAPDYVTSGLFYVFFTAEDEPGTPDNELGDLVIAEFDANEAGPIEDTRRDVLGIEHSSEGNHNGGQLQFGRDGFLYASTGDGGGSGDPDENAQDRSSLLGKILRIDPEQSGADAYTIPPGNPFAGDGTCGDGLCDEIWSYGLRNPWRFSFDRLTGSLLIGDVGQGGWEEVDFDPLLSGAGRGENFGWDTCEGLHGFEGGSDALCAGAVFTRPVFEYPNPPADGAAITGGYVVRDPSLGDLYGRYVYADLFVGQIRSLCPGLSRATGDRSEGLHVDFPTSFGEDAAGRVYVVSGGGPVSRLTGAAAPGTCPESSPSSPGALDTDAPELELDARRRHSVADSRTLKVRATVDEPADVELTTKLRTGGSGLRLGKEASSLATGVEEKLKLRLSRRETRRVRRRLGDGKKVKARVTGQATDASGNTGEDALAIRLVR